MALWEGLKRSHVQRSKKDVSDAIIKLQVFTSLSVYIDDDHLPHLVQPETEYRGKSDTSVLVITNPTAIAMSGTPYEYYVPLVQDQDQVPFDESQQPSSIAFPQNTFGQGSLDNNPYTMSYLPPTNPAVHNMAPSLSNWTGASDNPTQNPYSGSSYEHGPVQTH